MKNYETLNKSELLDLLAKYTQEYTHMVKEHQRTPEMEKIAEKIKELQKLIAEKK